SPASIPRSSSTITGTAASCNTSCANSSTDRRRRIALAAEPRTHRERQRGHQRRPVSGRVRRNAGSEVAGEGEHEAVHAGGFETERGVGAPELGADLGAVEAEAAAVATAPQ